MRVALFAMLLSIVQTAPPVPGQTADSANQSWKKAEKGTPRRDKQTVPPTAGAEQALQKATSKEAPTNRAASPNAEQAVRVRELPPVSVSRDWADWTLW